MSIRILTPDVVSKIAAGEVVERPASVVKELVENALDAGATRIAIEARGGGVSLIRVVDDGAGIPPDEVELAFHRHATSKIGATADLDAISSLGFRGEALPSIAAVAEVEMLTRTSDEVAGTSVKVQQGEAAEKTKKGCPQGTVVTVRSLFRNVPARLKFLKSAATESGHISNLVSQYSLAFPEVRFTLVIDGRTALQTPGGSLRDALVRVYGLETAQAMLPVAEGEHSLRVWGFVSPPSLSRSARGYLSFFVNRRWVNSRLLGRAVEDAYQGLIMTGRHPIAVLNISIPHQDIDVNVHPTKTQVRFRNEHALFAIVQRAVRRALVEQMPVPMVRQPAQAGAPAPPPQRQLPAEEAARVPLFPPEEGALARLPILRVLGQVASTYIIAEGPDGLYLIDQHAAHERVLYERVRSQMASREVEVQGLLEPVSIEVTPRQEETLTARAELLGACGFSIEPFGQRTYLLRAVPAVLKEKLADAVMEVLDSLGSDQEQRSWEEMVALSLACHGAVRAGQVLTQDEMRQLLRELEQTELPRTCPHGRPTTIRFTSSQLEREFGRR